MKTQALWMDGNGSSLFGVRHESIGTVRAGLLMCPPLLHEYVRSHRLFALLAHELASHGFNVLRFDYHGCGDSDGHDEAFSMPRAAQDAEVALARLRADTPGRPILALGIRAGAFPAAHLARTGKLDGLWLWQPIVDGAAYVRMLGERDAVERRSPMRYARVKEPGTGDAQTLMGYPCAAGLRDQLRQQRWSDTGIDAASVTVLEPAAKADSPAHSRFLELPESLSAWVEELDMARVAMAPIRAIAERLANAGTPA